METTLLTASGILLGLIVFGILANHWLVRIGAIRGNVWAVVILSFMLVIAKLVFLSDLSWWIFTLVAAFGVTLGVHRSDLGQTIKSGSYWWEKKRKGKKK